MGYRAYKGLMPRNDGLLHLVVTRPDERYWFPLAGAKNAVEVLQAREQALQAVETALVRLPGITAVDVHMSRFSSVAACDPLHLLLTCQPDTPVEQVRSAVLAEVQHTLGSLQ